MKYVVVTGGVVSGLGKGVTISSMGRLLQSCGLSVTAVKIDPYLNVDAGTMSPFEHGEVFVLNDGGESDLDLGNYERFLGVSLTSQHNLTTGKIYRKVILAERRGDYLGKTVQVVPHITDCIQEWIEEVAHVPVSEGSDKVADVCLIEVGGTVGDIESAVFLEALRQFQFRVGHDNFVLCFCSLVPILSDEQKTKPTQHGVRDLRSLGLSPSVIFCRSPQELQESTKQKISLFCHVPASNVLSVHDVNNVYHVPGLLQAQGLHDIVADQLGLPKLEPNLDAWNAMARSVDEATQVTTIALIGKYTGLQDSYLSVIKALRHAAIACNVRLNLEWVEASLLEKTPSSTSGEGDASEEASGGSYEEAWAKVRGADGVVVPGGFGQRGWQGKILAAEHCRVNSKPYLGVCLGFQAMIVEYCRNVLGWNDANSTEIDENTTHPAILFMPEIDKTTMGGTMRLGARTTTFTHTLPDDSPPVTRLLYGSDKIVERHRHRYEVNPELVDEIHCSGLSLVGRDDNRMEIAELSTHPYYVGCQFHPEFMSRPLHPSPPFLGLVLAACGKLDAYLAERRKETS
jgi:CTP synthase